MQSPIQLITCSNSDVIYFDHHTDIDDDDDSIVRKNVIKYLLDHDKIDNNENSKYSLMAGDLIEYLPKAFYAIEHLEENEAAAFYS